MLLRTVLLTALVTFGNANPVTPTYDTIIVGMGASGTTAASVLAKAGKKVLALEAQDRIGGRVYTVPFGDGIVEVGAEWIHGSEHSRVYELAVQHNISILPQDVSIQAFRSDGSRTDAALVDELVTFALDAVDEPPETPEPVGQYLTRRLMEYITQHHPALLADQDYIAQFLKFMDLIIDTYEASNSWNDVITHSNFVALKGNQNLSWNKYGYKTLFEILLNTYNNGPGLPTLDIKLNKVVSKITYPQQPDQLVEVTCEDGSVYTAKNVIVTVSIGVLKESHQNLFSPYLPRSKVESIESISFGTVGKIVLNFDQIWWDEAIEIYAFLWRDADRKLVSYEDRWLLTINGVAQTMGCNTTLSLWAIGDGARQVETLPDDEVKTKVMALIRKFLGKEKTIPEPIGMIRSKWFTNPYVRGTYTYDNLQTPAHPNARAILGEPLVDSSGAPRVLFAGEATDVLHFSTVHGATDAGHREATRLLTKSN